MRHAASLLFTLIVGAIPLSASADNAFTLRDAEVYTGPGTEYPPVANLPPNTTPAQLAAYTVVSRVLLNLDETITKE